MVDRHCCDWLKPEGGIFRLVSEVLQKFYLGGLFLSSIDQHAPLQATLDKSHFQLQSQHAQTWALQPWSKLLLIYDNRTMPHKSCLNKAKSVGV